METLILQHLGYHITSCTGSIEALDVFRSASEEFDLIITDFTMPDMPRDKLAAKLLQIRADILILLCTGFSEPMSEEKTKSIGIKGFLLKPVLKNDLADKIREMMDK